MGRIQEKRNREIIIKHYISENKKEENTELIQCQGCSNGDILNMEGTCLIKIYKKNLIGCNYINNSKNLNHNKIILPCNTFTLEKIAIEELIFSISHGLISIKTGLNILLFQLAFSFSSSMAIFSSVKVLQGNIILLWLRFLLLFI